MKLLAIILATLIISLTLIPCDDVNTLDSTQIEFGAENTNTDTHNLVDFCTPFCSCNCCSTIVINPASNHHISFIEIFHPEMITNYTAIFSNNLPQQIFQPPKV